MVMRYRLTYTVLADSRLQAIFKADALLRTGVTVVALVECEQGVPGWWDVVLDVEEAREPVRPLFLHEDPAFAPEQADEVTMAKAWADR